MSETAQSFNTFAAWVNKASSWLTRHPDYDPTSFRATCYDARGRLCKSGKDFMRARDENTFPVKWIWPDQIDVLIEVLNKVGAPGLYAAGTVARLMAASTLSEGQLTRLIGDRLEVRRLQDLGAGLLEGDRVAALERAQKRRRAS